MRSPPATRNSKARVLPDIQRLLYVAHDHLSDRHGVLRTANPSTDAVVLVESRRMTTGRNWHPERLFFMLSAARHFADQLESAGFTVRYIRAATTIDGLKTARQEFGELPIFAAEASSHVQLAQLTEFGVKWVPNDFFLTSREHFSLWANRQKSFLMETFYRAQRVRLNILVNGKEPVGGQWNFDHDNRLPPPKNYSWPDYLQHDRDELDLEVSNQVARELEGAADYRPTTTWATTRSGALAQLNYFIEHHLAGFGPYEDAVTKENWALHHSLLSPYLNVGLLHAEEVIEAIVEAFEKGRAPIGSVEAIVRQIIGWREYINGMYWHLGPDYVNANFLEAKRPLPPLFNDSAKTKMACVKAAVNDVEQRSWTHHIPRLMILSNLALISGTNPREYLDWMREQFIDASDWVMVPNVIGMATFADGGKLMTKPYAAGGAYLSRMTDHCKGCPFNPKLRTGDDACPFTTLYWDFIDRNKPKFAGNHRMAQSLMGHQRLSDKEQVRERAAQVLDLLERGEL